MKKHEKEDYQSPKLEIVEVNVEQGFSGSGYVPPTPDPATPGGSGEDGVWVD